MRVTGEKRGRGSARGEEWTAEWEWEERWTVEEDEDEKAMDWGQEEEETAGEVLREGRDFRKQAELRQRRAETRIAPPPAPSLRTFRALGRGGRVQPQRGTRHGRGESQEGARGTERLREAARPEEARRADEGEHEAGPRVGTEERREVEPRRVTGGVQESVAEEREERRRRVEWVR